MGLGAQQKLVGCRQGESADELTTTRGRLALAYVRCVSPSAYPDYAAAFASTSARRSWVVHKHLLQFE